jgi:hypothetical protein
MQCKFMNMTGTILIKGSGVAAVCCARSLSAINLQVSLATQVGRRSNAILLSEGSQALLCDLFENNLLFADLPRIRNRVVSWGPGAQVLTMPHSAVVIQEEILLDRLWSQLKLPTPQGPPEWQILSSPQMDHAAEQRAFGTQVASVRSATINATSLRETCWTESVRDGWLFLFTTEGDQARLMSVGDSIETLLNQSELIAKQVHTISENIGEFPAYPRILSPLCGPKWLACGSAAIAFDPLCGEGAGNAVREAILASAVVRAAARGAPEESLLTHYSSRLLQGFFRHLQVCQQFYKTGGDAPFWKAELHLLQQGIEWCLSQPMSVPKYRLTNFDLQEIE